MNCTSCGKLITDDAARCPYCGTPDPQGGALAGLVAAARTGDQKAMGALYEKTYSKVYYTVKSMIRDEDTVFDIVQDTYIKAFSRLDSLQGDTRFLPWVRQIAANTARDWLKKKRPTLFSELKSEDGQGTPVEELFSDERGANLPDQVIDQEETKRLIREIVDGLPEDQRAAIGMFYYGEMSVKEIAAAMGASESAVKSRLMYGRDKIERKVRELEKQGTKLYSLSPLSFLLLLFRNQEAYAAGTPDSRILQAILASRHVDAAGAVGTGTTGAAGAAGTKAAGAAASGTTGAAGVAGLGALKIGLIALVGAAAVGLVALGAVRIASGFAESQERPAIEEATDREESEAPEESGIPEDLEASEESEVQGEPETPEESSPIEEALEQYRVIVNQADSYKFGSASDLETYGYRYALVQMQPEDPVPTLLLEKEERGWCFAINTRVFQYDPDTKTVRQPDKTLGSGIRGGLAMAGDGNGITSTEWSGGTGQGSVSRITLDGDSLNWETCWTGRIDLMPESLTFIEIEWHEIADLSALDSWTAPDPDGAELSGPDDSNALPADGDRIVLTGTVGTYDYDGIVALQGQPDPNAFDEYSVRYSRSQTYRVIVLDAPQTLSLRSADADGGYFSDEVSMINLFYADGMEQYEGQHITFSIDPASTWWPSDTMLPLGQPSTKDIHILEYSNP